MKGHHNTLFVLIGVIKYNIRDKNGNIVDIIPELMTDCPLIRRHNRKDLEEYVRDCYPNEEQVLMNLDMIVDILEIEAKRFEWLNYPIRRLFVLKEFTGRPLGDCKRALSGGRTMGEAVDILLRSGVPLIQVVGDDDGDHGYYSMEKIFDKLFESVMENRSL